MKVNLSADEISVKLDQIADYVPGLSTLTNTVALIQQRIWKEKSEDHPAIKKDRYYTHITDKAKWRCVVLLLPFIGNFIVAVYDIVNKVRANKLQPKISEPDLVLPRPNLSESVMEIYEKANQGGVNSIYKLGLAFKERNLTEDAMACYQAAAEKDCIEAMIALGRTYQKSDENLAIASYEKAITTAWKFCEITNDCQESHYRAIATYELALLYKKQEGFEQARMRFTEASEAFEYAIAFYSNTPKQQELDECYQKAIESYLEIAKIYKDQKQIEEAIKSYEMAAKFGCLTFKKDTRAYIELARLCNGKKSLENYILAACFANNQEAIEKMKNLAKEDKKSFDECVDGMINQELTKREKIIKNFLIFHHLRDA